MTEPDASLFGTRKLCSEYLQDLEELQVRDANMCFNYELARGDLLSFPAWLLFIFTTIYNVLVLLCSSTISVPRPPPPRHQHSE